MEDAYRPPRVLVVEDDDALAAALEEYLAGHGFDVATVGLGEAAVERALSGDADVVVLDVMLPDRDGYSVAADVRDGTSVPVLMLTARSEASDKLRGFSAGADDYVVKPFDPEELVARLHALLRRSGRGGEAVKRVGSLVVDRGRRAVHLDGRTVFLTPREFDVLETLAAVPGRPLSRSQLIARAWGPEADTEDRTVDSTIVRLRRKLDSLAAGAPPPVVISTLWGVGYRLDATP
jgi:DNA-binding response OmpR family regulator